MFDGSFWDDVLGNARENIGSLFPSQQQDSKDPWGWITPSSQSSPWGWMSTGKGPQSQHNPFMQAIQGQQAATKAATTAQAGAAPAVTGPYYGGQFSYEKPLELSDDPETQQYLQMADEAAAAMGIDKDVFRHQINQESKFNNHALSNAGAQGLGQLMPGTAQELGVTDPYDPRQNLNASARYLRQQLDYYKGDYAKALAAYNAGAGNVDAWGDAGPQGEAAVYVNNVLAGAKRNAVAANPDPSTKPLHGLTAAQYGSEGLATGAADYICGPIAAQAFLKFHGRNPTLAETLQTARSMGVIDESSGMHGIESTASLIRQMGGVATTGAADPQTMIGELTAGRPVIVDTPSHYFVAEDYDPRTGKFDFGNSARALGTVGRDHGGNTWYTLEEIGHLMIGQHEVGAARGAIYAH